MRQSKHSAIILNWQNTLTLPKKVWIPCSSTTGSGQYTFLQIAKNYKKAFQSKAHCLLFNQFKDVRYGKVHANKFDHIWRVLVVSAFHVSFSYVGGVGWGGYVTMWLVEVELGWVGSPIEQVWTYSGSGYMGTSLWTDSHKRLKSLHSDIPKI